MGLEDFDPLEVDSKEASLGALVRGIIYTEKHIEENNEYKSKLNEFYEELDNREQNYKSYKDPPVYW